MNGVRIDRGVGVVVDHSWAAFTLGDTTERRETQLLHVLEEVVRKDNDHSFLAHLSHFFTKEISEGMGRRMITTLEGIVFLFGRPRLGLEQDRDSIFGETMEERGGTMAEGTDAPMDVGTASTRVKQLHPGVFIYKEICVEFNELTECI